MNCTDLVSCFIVANASFPYWNLIAIPLFAVLITLTFTIIAFIAGGKELLSSVPATISMSLMGLAIDTLNYNTIERLKVICMFTHMIPVTLFATNMSFILWLRLIPFINKYALTLRMKKLVAILSQFIIVPVWLIINGVVIAFIYGANASNASMIAIGITFHVVTILTSLYYGYHYCKIEFAPVEFILRLCLIAIVVTIAIMFSKLKLPIVAALIAGFPLIRLVALMNYTSKVLSLDDITNYIHHNTLTISSASLFTMITYYLYLIIDAPIASAIAYVIAIAHSLPFLIYRNVMKRSMVNVGSE